MTREQLIVYYFAFDIFFFFLYSHLSCEVSVREFVRSIFSRETTEEHNLWSIVRVAGYNFQKCWTVRESTFHGNYISRDHQVHREILPISKSSLDPWKFGKLCIRLLRITWLSVPIFITGGAYIYQFIYFNCVTRRCYRVGINHPWGVIKYSGIGAAPL